MARPESIERAARTPTEVVVMRHKKILGVALLAGVLVAGGTAFTASNSLPATSTAGFGSSTVSGVTVSNIHYNYSATDGSQLTSVVFTTATDVSGKNVAVTLYNASTAVDSVSTSAVGALTSPCSTSGTGIVGDPYLLTCSVSDPIASFDEVGLTVTD
jgi:hypothetical protein